MSLTLLVAPLSAAVKTENRTKVDLSGFLGGVARMFGGKAANEGVVSSTAVKGNRLMTVTDKTGQLIDLDEEKVYEIEFDKKRYRVKTFAEMREEMRKAAEQMAKSQPNAEPQPSEQGEKAKEVEVSVDVRETGERKNINGFDCREVVVVVKTYEKGKTLEAGGGMVISSNMWLGPELPGTQEVADFHRRYAEKLDLFSAMGAPSAQMAMVSNMYPMMKDAVRKMQEVDMTGSPILTVMTFETVAGEEQRQQAQQQQQAEKEQNIGSLGGLLGGLGRKMARKQPSEEEQTQPGRAKLMTTTSELLSATENVSDGDVTISPEFKERK
jgi:cell division protein FtsN